MIEPCQKCTSCGGSAHPASGSLYPAVGPVEPGKLICGRCVRHLWSWVNAHTRSRKRGPSFYDAARLEVPNG